jgi:hypothetical protein
MAGIFRCGTQCALRPQILAGSYVIRHYSTDNSHRNRCETVRVLRERQKEKEAAQAVYHRFTCENAWPNTSVARKTYWRAWSHFPGSNLPVVMDFYERIDRQKSVIDRDWAANNRLIKILTGDGKKFSS